MSLKADSAEFARLLDRWMDATHSKAEAALLWRCVRESAECAAEFAAAARFEGLLADTTKARNIEAEARKVLAVAPRQTAPLAAPVPTVARPWAPMQVLAWAAVLVLAGVIAALLWPEGVADPVVVQKHRDKRPVAPVPEVIAPERPASFPEPPMEKMAAGVAAPGLLESSLVERLDRFFIRGVQMEQVPLGQAMALLKQALVEKDYLKTLPLDRLRVTVPAGALGRRVSFSCGAIPYLKAVQAVAALAGCDVEVGDLTIALTLQPGIFPQVAEKRVLGDLLAGRLTPGGSAMVEDAGRMQALWADASLLGIPVAADGTAQVSRGQWEALRLLTDMRDQLGLLPMPTFAVYAVPEGSAPPDGVLSPEQQQIFIDGIKNQGLQPVHTFTPQLAGPDNPSPVTLMPDGETVNLVSSVASASSPDTPLQKPVLAAATTVIGSVTTSGTVTGSAGSMAGMSVSQRANAAAFDSLSTVAGVREGMVFVIVPVTPVPQNPP